MGRDGARGAGGGEGSEGEGGGRRLARVERGGAEPEAGRVSAAGAGGGIRCEAGAVDEMEADPAGGEAVLDVVEPSSPSAGRVVVAGGVGGGVGGVGGRGGWGGGEAGGGERVWRVCEVVA